MNPLLKIRRLVGVCEGGFVVVVVVVFVASLSFSFLFSFSFQFRMLFSSSRCCFRFCSRFRFRLNFEISMSLSKGKQFRNFDVVVEGEGKRSPFPTLPRWPPGGGSRGRVAGEGSRGVLGGRKLGRGVGNSRRPPVFPKFFDFFAFKKR